MIKVVRRAWFTLRRHLARSSPPIANQDQLFNRDVRR
jgi:hypothetical protein